ARLAARFPLTVWSRTATRAEELSKVVQAHVARTPRECVRTAEVVITCLADAAALEQVLGGEDGVLEGLEPDAVLLEMSTIGRAAAREAARAVEARGARFVDAPVSGTVGPAERGELVALVGGAPRDIEHAKPVLDVLCSRVVHAGGV